MSHAWRDMFDCRRAERHPYGVDAVQGLRIRPRAGQGVTTDGTN